MCLSLQNSYYYCWLIAPGDPVLLSSDVLALRPPTSSVMAFSLIRSGYSCFQRTPKWRQIASLIPQYKRLFQSTRAISRVIEKTNTMLVCLFVWHLSQSLPQEMKSDDRWFFRGINWNFVVSMWDNALASSLCETLHTKVHAKGWDCHALSYLTLLTKLMCMKAHLPHNNDDYSNNALI